MSLKNNLKVNECTLFYIALGLLYINGIIGQTTMVDLGGVALVRKAIKWTMFICLMGKLLIQKYPRQSIWKLIVVGLVVLLSYFLCGQQDLIWGCLFIFAARDIEMRKVAKEVMWLTVIGVLVVMLMADIGLIESIVQETTSTSRHYFWSGGDTIKMWGFKHHNYLGCRALIFYTCYVFLRYDRFRIYDLITCAVCFYFCYYTEKSRTAAALILIVTALVLLFKALRILGERHNKNLVKIGAYIIMLFCPIFSVFVSMTYDEGKPFYLMINQLINNRFSYASSILQDYGYSLFGQEIELVSSLESAELGIPAVILDNAYMCLFIRCGIVLGMLVLIGYFYAAGILIKEKNYAAMVMIMSYFVCGISEGWFYLLTYNPFLLLLSVGLYREGLVTSSSSDINNRITIKPLKTVHLIFGR